MQIVVFLLIGLVLVLVGVSGLQFSYMFYVDRLNRARSRHLRDLERRCLRLTESLDAARSTIAERDDLIRRYFADGAEGEDVWAEVIDIDGF
jgi:hypothetical protein